MADADGGGKPEVILMATGTELGLIVDAYERLKKDGVRARVVSMPSWELFEEQDEAYRASVLPPDVTARVSVEMAGTFGWHKYVGSNGVTIGMKSFGARAAQGPAEEVQLHPRGDRPGRQGPGRQAQGQGGPRPGAGARGGDERLSTRCQVFCVSRSQSPGGLVGCHGLAYSPARDP